MPEAQLHRLGMAHPGDVSALAALFDLGSLNPHDVCAVIGKTEGNGGVNDFTRGYFTQSLMLLLGGRRGVAPDVVARAVPCVLSGGTEGVLSPHYLVFARLPSSAGPGEAPALAIGTAFTDELPPESLGRVAQAEATSRAVQAAMRDAGLRADEVRFVQVKTPCLTAARVEAALARGQAPATTDPGGSMALARAAAALGAAHALGELSREALRDAALLTDRFLWSGRASVSSGIEIERTEVIVLGNSLSWSGRLAVASRPMLDALDIAAVHGVLDDLGIPSCPQVAASADRIHGVLVKGEPDRHGRVRGHRHTMLDDTDIDAQRHLRGALGGMVAGVLGDGRIFVSGGAEHQGPDGGGLIAVIAARA